MKKTSHSINILPSSNEEWLKETAKAYCDAYKTLPFGDLVGCKITPIDLFHLGPAICMKFRGIKSTKARLKKVTEAALSSYIATKENIGDLFDIPQMSFAFSYVVSHYSLDLLEKDICEDLLHYIEENLKKLVDLTQEGGFEVKKNFKNVYQFKITLRDIEPKIWRVIQVPETYTFWDLHVAIQNAMGWGGGHLHAFHMKNPMTGEKVEIGRPNEEFDDVDVLIEWKQLISKLFTAENKKAEYVYDFGDSWEHEIKLEKICLAEDNAKYPKCLYGERACPPEDCGGSPGYEDLSEIIKDKNHEEYESMLEWLGGEYDPEKFDAKDVYFEDPKKRFEYECS